MSIDLIHEWFFKQKFEYLHNNPCQPHWQLATLSEDYKYSSASFYDTGLTDLGFLHIIQKFKIVGRETNNNKGFDYLKAKGHFI
jgi:hypothetical protein